MQLKIENCQLLLLRKFYDPISIPLEDINSIVIESRDIQLSSYLLSEIGQYNIPLYLCDKKHIPSSVVLPFSKHSRHFRMLKNQINMSEPLRKRLWQQVVKFKICNQMDLLKALEKDSVGKLSTLSATVKSGDTTNNEAQAALVYFKALFGRSYRRGDEADKTNSALDYGYTILRGLVARSVIAYGFEPSIGINHCSELNAYNLADDLMEPFRPVVDRLVYQYIQEKEDFFEVQELTSEERRYILNLHDVMISVKGRKQLLYNGINVFVESFSKSLSEKKCLIEQPQICKYEGITVTDEDK